MYAIRSYYEWQIPIILVGDSGRIEAELKKYQLDGLDIAVRHATEVVGMHDSASDAVRKKKDSSIRIAFNLVKNGEAQAVVSAGNSGATMAAGMFVLGRIKGIDRPAIATIMPNLKDNTLRITSYNVCYTKLLRGTASCINAPRCRTRRTASAKARVSAQTVITSYSIHYTKLYDIRLNSMTSMPDSSSISSERVSG